MRIIDEISMKINELISSGPSADIEKNVRALLQGALSRMELVTREEFDVQTQVLLQTRNRLAELEQKVAELEARGALQE